jgi:hypothetical protein
MRHESRSVARFAVSFVLSSLLLWSGTAPGANDAPRGRALGNSQPDYTADLSDPQLPAQARRIELHWIAVAGTNRTRPVLWEPGPRCLTLLRDPARVRVDNWVLTADATANAVANDECRPMQSIGATSGVESVHVLMEARGERITYRVGIAPRSPSPKVPAMLLSGSLQPSAPIAARKVAGRFAEKALIDAGFASLNEIFLVTSYGIFKGTERAQATGGGGFTVITTTDLYRAFRPGDLFVKASRDPGSPLQMRLIWRQRSGDGSVCPDTDGRISRRVLRFVSLRNGVRTWQLEPAATTSGDRYCALQRINNRTCQIIDCVQWSDTLKSMPGDEIEILTDNEAHARKLHAALPALTLASSGVKHDSATWKGTVRERGGSGSASPWGECGLEGCDARRRREQIEQFVIDQWNR